MADRDILERLDAHMERGNELMCRVEEQMRLTREFHHAQISEMRDFTRQMILRMERIGRDQSRQLSRQNDRLERMTDELERRGREGREESRMHRNALLKVLDRMDRLEPPPAAA